VQESELSEQPDRSDIIVFDSSIGQYALAIAGGISHVDVGEMFEMLNNSKVILCGRCWAIPKLTLWYCWDDTVFVYEGEEVCVEQITVSDFNSNLDYWRNNSIISITETICLLPRANSEGNSEGNHGSANSCR